MFSGARAFPASLVPRLAHYELSLLSVVASPILGKRKSFFSFQCSINFLVSYLIFIFTYFYFLLIFTYFSYFRISLKSREGKSSPGKTRRETNRRLLNGGRVQTLKSKLFRRRR